jgi:hypothetical protein
MRGRYRFDFFDFLAFFLGIILLTPFLAFLAIDFAALTTRPVTVFFLCLLSHGIVLSVLTFSISSWQIFSRSFSRRCSSRLISWKFAWMFF